MPFPVVNPLLTGSQVSPLSVERITPTGPPRGSPPAKISPLALIASERNVAFGTPVLSPVQVSPLSVERNAPPPNVPAKMSPPELIASEMTNGNSKPLLTAVQLSPLSVDRNTPPNVPAKMSPTELIASARTFVAVSPLLTPVHVSPLSVERNTPPPCVPTKTCPFGFVASAMPSPPCGPFVCAQKFWPAGSELALTFCLCVMFELGFA